jgi:hypothetical protein
MRESDVLSYWMYVTGLPPWRNDPDTFLFQEIDKVIDEKTLFSLLMPWELGKCSFVAGQRHVNARSVIWIATANTGHQLVFDHQTQRADLDASMDRKEYIGADQFVEAGRD